MPRGDGPVRVSLRVYPGNGQRGNHARLIQKIIDDEHFISPTDTVSLIDIMFLLDALDDALFEGTEVCGECGARGFSKKDSARLKREEKLC